jgi:hypothetical protein
MLKRITALKLPVTTCTIYNPRFDNSHQQAMCETGLSALNDVIVTQSTKVYIQILSIYMIKFVIFF